MCLLVEVYVFVSLNMEEGGPHLSGYVNIVNSISTSALIFVALESFDIVNE